MTAKPVTAKPVTGNPVEPGFAESLRAAAEPCWSEACSHRFTRELAAGSLDRAVFGRYLVQDYAFIDALARLLGYGVAHAPAMPQQTRLATLPEAV